MQARSKREVAADILVELRRLQGLSSAAIIGRDTFQLPRLIPAGNGRTIHASKTLDDLIRLLSARLREGRMDLAKTVHQNDWFTRVRSTIGPILATIDLDRPPLEAGADLLAALETALHERFAAALVPAEHVFGATLFGNPVPPFAIGPVRIETADDWLTRKTSEGEVSAITARRIRRVWDGKRVARRTDAFARAAERDILAAIDGAPYVLSIRLHGYVGRAALQASVTAARLALTSISLL